MSFLRTLFGSPGLKLLSLLLAWSVWSLVRSGLENEQWVQLPMTLQVDGYPEMDAALTDRGPDWSPQLQVLGSDGAIASLISAREPIRLRVRETALEPGQQDGRQTYRLKDLEFSGQIKDGAVRVTGMKPEEFKVSVWRVEVRTPAVDSRVEIQGLETLSDNLTVVPFDWPKKLTLRGKATDMTIPSVRIYLPEEQLRNIEQRFGSRMREEFSVTYALVDELGLYEVVHPEELNGKVAVTYRAERALAVPIELHMIGADRRNLVFPEINATDVAGWIPRDPKDPTSTHRLTVTFEGSPRALEQLDDPVKAGAIRGFVSSREFPQDATTKYLRVHFSGLPDGVIPSGVAEVGVELR